MDDGVEVKGIVDVGGELVIVSRRVKERIRSRIVPVILVFGFVVGGLLKLAKLEPDFVVVPFVLTDDDTGGGDLAVIDVDAGLGRMDDVETRLLELAGVRPDAEAFFGEFGDDDVTPALGLALDFTSALPVPVSPRALLDMFVGIKGKGWSQELQTKV